MSVHHQVGNLSIRCGEREATASRYGIAYHYRPTKSGRNTRVFVDGNRELEKEPTRVKTTKLPWFPRRRESCSNALTHARNTMKSERK